MKAEDVLRSGGKREILVVGDDIADVYVRGHQHPCQDGCPKFVEGDRVTVLGGAANAANCLKHSGSAASNPFLNCDLAARIRTPVKTRFLEGARILYRHDLEAHNCGLSLEEWRSLRAWALNRISREPPDAVYVSDYDKGFLTDEFVRQVVAECRRLDIVCVVDPKRDPACCQGAVLKCNAEFACHWFGEGFRPITVITRGPAFPSIMDDNGLCLDVDHGNMDNRVPCANHVGAGDCFGAWLTLGLAHGLSLREAARLGHAAGRVYVQHPHNRAPWPHEIGKELDPVGGKAVTVQTLPGLRQSFPGRVGFTNGCFRLPHAGHADFLNWCRPQCDLLVVGVNSNVSAYRNRPGAFCLPVEERLSMLCSMGAVDYAAVFDEDGPRELIRALRPDVVFRGHDQTPEGVLECEVFQAPPGRFKAHARDIVKSIRG